MVNTTRIKDVYRSLELQGAIDTARGQFLDAILKHKVSQLEKYLRKNTKTAVEKEACQTELNTIKEKLKQFNQIVFTSSLNCQKKLVTLVSNQNKLKNAQDLAEEKQYLLDVEKSLASTQAAFKLHADLETNLNISLKSLNLNLEDLSPVVLKIDQDIKALEGLQKRECNPALSIAQEVEAMLSRIQSMKIEEIASHHSSGVAPHNPSEKLAAAYKTYNDTIPKTDESLMILSHEYAKHFKPLLKVITFYMNKNIERQSGIQNHNIKIVGLIRQNELDLLQKEYNNRKTRRKNKNASSRSGLTAEKEMRRREAIIVEAEKFTGPTSQEAYKKFELQHLLSMSKASIYAYVGEGVGLTQASKKLQGAYRDLQTARKNKNSKQTQACLLRYLLQRKIVEEGFQECEHRASAHPEAAKILPVTQFMKQVQDGISALTTPEDKLAFLALQFRGVDDTHISLASKELKTFYQQADKKDFFDHGVLNQVSNDPGVYLSNKMEELTLFRDQDEINQSVNSNKKAPGLLQKFINLFVEDRHTHLALKSRRRIEGVEREINDIQDLLLQILMKSMMRQCTAVEKLDQVHLEGEQRSSHDDHKAPAPAHPIKKTPIIETSPFLTPPEKKKKPAKGVVGFLKRLVKLDSHNKKPISSTAAMEIELSTITHQVRTQPEKSNTNDALRRHPLFNKPEERKTLLDKVVQKVKAAYHARKQKHSPHAAAATEATSLASNDNQKSYNTMPKDAPSAPKHKGIRRLFSALRRY